MIDLSKNQNPYYPTKKIYRKLKKEVKSIKFYSEDYVKISLPKTSGNRRITERNFLITNGTMEAMDLILFAKKEKKIGFMQPTFWGIKTAANRNSYEIIEEHFEENMEYNTMKIDELAKKVDIVYLCNDNNPTLSYLDNKELYKLIKDNKNCSFIVDETVLTFDLNYDNLTMINYITELKNLNVIVSLSKILSIPGLRCGLIVSDENNIENYKINQTPYSTNIFIAKNINMFLNERDRIKKSKIKIKNNFIYLKKSLEKENFKKLINNVKYKYTGFMLVELCDKVNYNDLIEFLNQNKIFLSTTNKYYGNLRHNYLRISAGKKKEFRVLIKTLKKYLNKM